MPIRPELRHFYRTPEWFAARDACRERAGNRCQRCGAANGATYARLPGAKFGLDAAGRRFFEILPQDAEAARRSGHRVTLIQCGCCHKNNIPGDDRPANLAFLCRGCHLRFDFRHHALTRKIRKDAKRPLLAYLIEHEATPSTDRIRPSFDEGK